MSYVNLLPEDYLARQKQRRANLLYSALFCVVMTGVIAAAVVSQRSHNRTRQVICRVNEAYAHAGNLIRQLQELESTKQRMLKKANMTAQLVERLPRSFLLAAVTNALPPGASLKCFELSGKRLTTAVISKAQKVRGLSVADKKVQRSSRMNVAVTVTGLAGTDVEVARFIAQMARCPIVEAVDLVYSEQKEVNTILVREFQVVMRVKDGADVRQIDRGAVLVSARAQPAPVAGETQ